MRDHNPIADKADDEKDKRAKSRMDLALRSVMATREGRMALQWVLDSSGVNSASFSPNALTMAYSEGRRSVGIQLAERLRAVSLDYFRLMKDESYE